MKRQDALRVLILEDEFIVAMYLEDLLVELGHQVVQSFARMDEAFGFASHSEFDFGVLDINLGGEKTFPVAEILRRRGIPFVFATGYGAAGLSDDFHGQPTLQKPYDQASLARVIAEARDRVGG